MNTLLILMVLLLAAAPLLKRLFDSWSIDVNEKKYALLTRVVEDATAHVSQIATNEELSAEQKKERALEVATNMSLKIGLGVVDRGAVSDLIESVLWKDIPDVNDDEDDDDDY